MKRWQHIALFDFYILLLIIGFMVTEGKIYAEEDAMMAMKYQGYAEYCNTWVLARGVSYLLFALLGIGVVLNELEGLVVRRRKNLGH